MDRGKVEPRRRGSSAISIVNGEFNNDKDKSAATSWKRVRKERDDNMRILTWNVVCSFACQIDSR